MGVAPTRHWEAHFWFHCPSPFPESQLHFFGSDGKQKRSVMPDLEITWGIFRVWIEKEQAAELWQLLQMASPRGKGSPGYTSSK